MNTQLAPIVNLSDAIERLLMTGDIVKLDTEQRLAYYKAVCESMGLNPLTRPFDYLVLNGKTVLYAKRDCTDQLRKIHNVSVVEAHHEYLPDEILIVTTKVSLPNGRTDISTGAVSLAGLKGEARSNAIMKADTKAKRRATLSICGLGILDESEVESTGGKLAPNPPLPTTVYAPKEKKAPEKVVVEQESLPPTPGVLQRASIPADFPAPNRDNAPHVTGTAREQPLTEIKTREVTIEADAGGFDIFVSGDTFDIKNSLKALGAKWDAKIKGWKMPIDRESDVRELCRVNSIETI